MLVNFILLVHFHKVLIILLHLKHLTHSLLVIVLLRSYGMQIFLMVLDMLDIMPPLHKRLRLRTFYKMQLFVMIIMIFLILLLLMFNLMLVLLIYYLEIVMVILLVWEILLESQLRFGAEKVIWLVLRFIQLDKMILMLIHKLVILLYIVIYGHYSVLDKVNSTHSIMLVLILIKLILVLIILVNKFWPLHLSFMYTLRMKLLISSKVLLDLHLVVKHHLQLLLRLFLLLMNLVFNLVLLLSKLYCKDLLLILELIVNSLIMLLIVYLTN